MKTINITKKTFNKLEPLNLSKKILNGEATIYEFNYHNQNKVLKKLYNNKGENFANKLLQLKCLILIKNYFQIL